MKQKLFSVIIPTFNCGRKLAATIESVLSQPGQLFELIVVDGGSTDETLDVIEEYRGEIRFISEADRGVYDAFNKGIRMSSGKYIYFLGAGDRLREGVLETVAGMLPEGELAFVYGDAYLVRSDFRMGCEFRKKYFRVWNICHQAIFYERTIFDVVGEFDLKYRVYADWAYNMKCFAHPRVRTVYTGLLVADFEGWGISDTQEDPDFMGDLPRLLWKYVGVREYVRHRIYLARVAVYVFRHGLADSVKTAGQSAFLHRRQKSYDAVKKANSAQ
ncbi:MAG: glycosyltransferase family 2 protein [Pyrinomonadaceae bacterium]